jgi:hypothetical protein
MRRNRASLFREKAARVTEAQASIGRAMRLVYDVSQPLTDRLADLVSKIEQPQSGGSLKGIEAGTKAERR